MVDDIKRQMCRFENLIGFEGKLTVTSRKSMQELIDVVSSKYKRDVQSSLRLHRLEFFYDLVESQLRKREKREDSISDQRAKQKMVKEEESKPTDGEEQQQFKEEVKPKISDEVVQVKAEDIDDWKDLMTLSRIYYVMEHPRSVGLTWKRRITKKKKIDKFEDMDLIEWRVSQNFRLRGLEEWAQRRSDARRLAELSGYYSEDTDESEENTREMDDLFQMFDPSGKSQCTKKADRLKKKKPSSDRPFKLFDESIEDWTESYSEDSECSGEDFLEDIEDFSDEVDIKVFDTEEDKSPVLEEEDISELLAVYPHFLKYREPIFKEMDEAKTFEDWFSLYTKASSQFEERKAEEQVVKFEEKPDRLYVITEEAEEKYDELLEKEEEAEEKYDELLEKDEEAGEIPVETSEEDVKNAEEKQKEDGGIEDRLHMIEEQTPVGESENIEKTKEDSEETEETISRNGEEVTKEEKDKNETAVKSDVENQEIGGTEFKTSSQNQETEEEYTENEEEEEIPSSFDETDSTADEASE